MKKFYGWWFALGTLGTASILYFLKCSSDSAAVQLALFATAILWFGDKSIIRALKDKLSNCRRIELTFVLLIIVIRLLAQQIFPPHDQSGFEELQLGGSAHKVLNSGLVGLEFRFTTLLAALGLYIFDYSLSSLRFWFKLSGVLSLLLMFVYFRKAGISLATTLVVVSSAASFPWLVVAGTVADEIASPIALCILVLIACRQILYVNASRHWFGALGVLSGVLMFEYVSYRIYVLIALVSILPALLRKEITVKSKFFLFLHLLIPFVLVALPLLIDTMRLEGSSIWFEWVVRHRAGRESVLAESAFWNWYLYLNCLFGGKEISTLFLAAPGMNVINSIVGSLFGAAMFYSILISRSAFLITLSLLLLLSALVAGALANNVFVLRMTAVIPILYVLSGHLLEWLAQRFKAVFGARIGTLAICIFFPLLLIATGITHIRELISLSERREVLSEWANDGYALAKFIADFSAPFDKVILVAHNAESKWGRNSDQEWLWWTKKINIVGMRSIPESAQSFDRIIVDTRDIKEDLREIKKSLKMLSATEPVEHYNIAGNLVAIGSALPSNN